MIGGEVGDVEKPMYAVVACHLFLRASNFGYSILVGLLRGRFHFAQGLS